MKLASRYTVGFRRKRKGLTDYRKRLKVLMAKKPRLVVRRSLQNMYATITEFNTKGDLIKASANGKQLAQFGWNFSCCNLPASYLVGYLAGKRALKAGVKEAVLDLGLQKTNNGSRLYAVLFGAIDAGLSIPHAKEVLPSKERVKGEHIKSYAAALAQESMAKQFSSYIKRKEDPKNIPAMFDKVKQGIDKQ